MEYSELSDGAFDVSVWPLVVLWAIGTEHAAVPDPVELDRVASLVDYRRVELNRDNLTIELNADETPSTDGSPMPFVEAIQKAGIETQEAEKEIFVIREPVSVSEGDAMLAALPGPADCLEILYDLDDPRCPSVGRQVLGFRLDKDDFVTQIAPARTFLLEKEAREQQARGDAGAVDQSSRPHAGVLRRLRRHPARTRQGGGAEPPESPRRPPGDRAGHLGHARSGRLPHPPGPRGELLDAIS